MWRNYLLFTFAANPSALRVSYLALFYRNKMHQFNAHRHSTLVVVGCFTMPRK